MPDFWALNPFSIKIRKNKRVYTDTKQLWHRAQSVRSWSPQRGNDELDFAGAFLKPILADYGFRGSVVLMSNLLDVVSDFYTEEALTPVGKEVLHERTNSRADLELREYLRRQITFFENYTDRMPAFEDTMAMLCHFLLGLIPDYALSYDADHPFLTIRLTDLCDDVHDATGRIVTELLTNDDIQHHNLYLPCRKRLEANLLRIAKIDPAKAHEANPHRLVMPPAATHLDAEAVVDEYLIGTPFRPFLKTELPLEISDQTRYEHVHILGGTGHGKTQFLQKWICHDLDLAAQAKRSLVVIDGQGDLIRNISKLDIFHPDHGPLKDKIIIIDPNDVLYPPAINMFATNDERMAQYGPAEREKVQNSAVALYEDFFRELLGAELTAQQGTVFKYLARLMLEIPDATIVTLRELMEDPKPFIPYMKQLTGSARVFFARDFFNKSFNATKKQISKRLLGVMSTPAFERIFSGTENKIDLFEKLNDGSIILINTAKEMLKDEGAKLFGRFFTSMIGQAVLERAAVLESDRTPTFLYIDECHDYFDSTIEMLLAQGRKYKISVTLAHQHLDQLNTSQRGSVLGNTSVKACGGMNAKDAGVLAKEMRVTHDFLQNMRKREGETEFALSIKHQVPSAIKVSIPFGLLEERPAMDADARERLQEVIRERYCWKYEANTTEIDFPDDPSPSQPPPPKKPDPKPSSQRTKAKPVAQPKPREPVAEIDTIHAPEPILRGKGGKRHTYLQNLVSTLAQEQGWRTEIEYNVLEGTGQIDVALLKGDRMIACEISVTTPTKHEVANIKKCLQAGAEEVWVIAQEKKKLSAIEVTAKKILGKQLSQVQFLLPDQLPTELEANDANQGEAQLVLGYRVKVKRSVSSLLKAENRRKSILSTIVKKNDL